MHENIFKFLNQHIHVSHETCERLHIYHDLLLKWQQKINLIGSDTIPNVWNRHFLDSLQLINYLPKTDAKIADLGSGAGFPGMALAIAGMGNVHLIESDTRKILFLKEVARSTGTKISIHHGRIEERLVDGVDIIVSRACSNLSKLLSLSSYYVSHETTSLFHKGKNYSIEIREANKEWLFDHTITPSITDTHGVILTIQNLRKKV